MQSSTKTWQHFDLSIVRVYTNDHEPERIDVVFRCKVDPAHVQERPRQKGGDGTSNFNCRIITCNKKFMSANSSVQPDLHQTVSQYTPHTHRVILALQSAESKRPFSFVRDRYFVAGVELLRPGTILPSPQTVSRDVVILYQACAQYVKEYFAVYCHHSNRDKSD